MLVVPVKVGDQKQQPTHEHNKEAMDGEDAGATVAAVKEEATVEEEEEVDVGWLVGVLPAYLLALITTHSPSSAFNR